MLVRQLKWRNGPPTIVYELCYPPDMPTTGRQHDVFYIGYGKPERPRQHEHAARAGHGGACAQAIRSIWASNRDVVKRVVFSSPAPNYGEAEAVEAFLIDHYGLETLTNTRPGTRRPICSRNGQRHKIVAIRYEDHAVEIETEAIDKPPASSPAAMPAADAVSAIMHMSLALSNSNKSQARRLLLEATLMLEEPPLLPSPLK